MGFGWFDFFLISTAGGLIGFLAGMFGVGGGFLLVPILNIVLGIPMELAVGASACQVLGPATTSLLARKIKGRDLFFPLVITGGLLLGVIAGTGILEHAKSSAAVMLNGRNIIVADLVVLIAYFLMLTGLGILSLRSARRDDSELSGTLFTDRFQIPPVVQFPGLVEAPLSIPVIAWFGLGLGLVSGLLGISGGILLFPILIFGLGIPTHRAITCSLVIVWIVAFQSTIAHAWHGNISIMIVIALLLGGTVGARLGSDLNARLKGLQLRRQFGWLLLSVALMIGTRLVFLLAG
ncbi:sulfite exporter TauE/SafE family protein [Gimesia algae]|uniref:Probable membrane transporter protein n=1 Tax=Gimesia algae TaxID=2527971 RepID=A0A517VMV0_9PLAN|nr:sulfite exporter TauE/SafE family protein [Gimesia algae]QDT94334.1 Sulfite exporter TauE/SafE [Gimesia algae]